MSPGAFSCVFGSTWNTVFKRFGITLLKTLFIYLITFLFVQLPTFLNLIMTLGRDEDRSRLQKRIRAKITNPSDCSAPYRAVEVLDKLRTTPDEYVKTLADIPEYCLQHYADKETLGVREILDVQDEKQSNGKIFKKFVLGEYKFTTYRETYNHIEAIGRGLLSIGAKPGDKVLIFSETRSEWLLTAFAAFRHGITVVTLYATLGEEAVKHGINESQVSIIFTSNELLTKLEQILDHTEKVRHVIYFPSLAKSQTVKLSKDKHNIEYIPLSQLEEKGKNATINDDIVRKRPNRKDIAVIMYTSGSTGTPKG
ncbi:unnamed protein product [Rotaria sp. Silwood2]|nr:unnamed protein product [Rotaria sp. Silwood2]CAF3287665.1 unnamed protein product [Rotaria sp. Silwood2]CAF4486273.1 unnamed protein product [Rotaria sp. Silwood2]